MRHFTDALFEDIEQDAETSLGALQKELDKFDYAFIDGDGNELSNEDAMEAVVQSPEQLAKLGKGVCTDYVEYSKAWLEDKGIKYSTYDVSFIDEDGDEPSHTFIVAEMDDKFIWVENAWFSEKGNHEYSSMEELFTDIATKHCRWDDNDYLDSCVIRQFDKSLVGMSQQEIYDFMHTLPAIWKPKENINEALETKIVRRDNPADFSPFGYKVDFYDGDKHIGEGSVCGVKDDNAFLYDFEVYPEFRGKGYSKEMLQFMIDKYDLKQLYVDQDNTVAVNLYKKFGFVIDGEVDDDGKPAYNMVRE